MNTLKSVVFQYFTEEEVKKTSSFTITTKITKYIVLNLTKDIKDL